jgi:hypothetical protein
MFGTKFLLAPEKFQWRANVKIKTNALTGIALDWAIAKCEGRTDKYWMNHSITGTYSPSTYWMLGGPIIERERIDVFSVANGNGWCSQSDVRVFNGYGATPLLAAMRCYVASKLGNEVEVPDEVANQQA